MTIFIFNKVSSGSIKLLQKFNPQGYDQILIELRLLKT